jgi:hypothetical protein
MSVRVDAESPQVNGVEAAPELRTMLPLVPVVLSGCMRTLYRPDLRVIRRGESGGFEI